MFKEMSTYDIIHTLWDLGHFFSPKVLAIDLVNEKLLDRLKLDDDVVIAAIQSYQEYMKPSFDRIMTNMVQRKGIPDGEVGPGTIQLLLEPRCGMPDFYLKGPLKANWPTSCRDDITTSYNMALSGLTPEELKRGWEDSEIEKVFNIKFRHLPGDYPNTRIYAIRANLGQNILADQYLAQNNCSARLRGRFSNRQWNYPLYKTVKEHEHGHAIGLDHLNDPDATMYPSIHNASLARQGAFTEADIQAGLALGYQRRTTETPNQKTLVITAKGPITITEQ